MKNTSSIVVYFSLLYVKGDWNYRIISVRVEGNLILKEVYYILSKATLLYIILTFLKWLFVVREYPHKKQPERYF